MRYIVDCDRIVCGWRASAFQRWSHAGEGTFVTNFLDCQKTVKSSSSEVRTQVFGLLIALALVLTSVFSLVTMTGSAQADEQAKNSADVRIVTTIKPIHSLVAAIIEGVGEPHLLVKGAGSPHTYRLKPSDARALNKAALVVRVGDEIEPFMAKVAKSLPKQVQILTLIDLPGLKVLPVRQGEEFDHHEEHQDVSTKTSGHHHHHNHHHGHDDEGHDQHEAAHKAGSRDGHIWLSPSNARVMVQHLTAEISGKWPAHKALFEKNATRVIAQIEALERKIALDLSAVRDGRFIVFHDAFQYFEKAFGLKASTSVVVHPEVPLGAKRLLAVRETIKRLQVKCAFREPQFKTRVFDTVVEGLNVRGGVLDPLGANLKPGPKLYPQLLESLATRFQACLS